MPSRPVPLWVHGLIFALILYACFELLAALGLRVLAQVWGHEYRIIDAQHFTPAQQDVLRRLLDDRLEYLQHDPELGWTIRAWGYGQGQNGLYRSNNRGLRADTDVSPAPPLHGLRVAAFGDSFTHGDDVAVGDTWEDQLAQRLPGVEILNFGVPGYGVDQAFLHYLRDGLPLQPDIVLIGFMPENVYRHLNVYRPFYYPDTGIPLAKPRFILENGQLKLLPNPLTRIEDYRALLNGEARFWQMVRAQEFYTAWRPVAGSLDHVPSVRLAKFLGSEMRRRMGEREITQDLEYNAEGEAFKLTEALLSHFAETVSRHGSIPIVLVFPERADVLRYRASGRTRYPSMVARLRAKGIEVVDLIEAFRSAAPGLREFGIDHYTEHSNALVARQLQEYLIRETLPQAVDHRYRQTLERHE